MQILFFFLKGEKGNWILFNITWLEMHELAWFVMLKLAALDILYI